MYPSPVTRIEKLSYIRGIKDARMYFSVYSNMLRRDRDVFIFPASGLY